MSEGEVPRPARNSRDQLLDWLVAVVLENVIAGNIELSSRQRGKFLEIHRSVEFETIAIRSELDKLAQAEAERADKLVREQSQGLEDPE